MSEYSFEVFGGVWNHLGLKKVKIKLWATKMAKNKECSRPRVDSTDQPRPWIRAREVKFGVYKPQTETVGEGSPRIRGKESSLGWKIHRTRPRTETVRS